jgi:hypothetical protein
VNLLLLLLLLLLVYVVCCLPQSADQGLLMSDRSMPLNQQAFVCAELLTAAAVAPAVAAAVVAAIAVGCARHAV